MRRGIRTGAALWLLSGCHGSAGDPVALGPPCPPGEVLDEDGSCVPEACGIGQWGDLPVDEATVYVDGASAEGGDGAADAPFRTIQEGADAAGAAGGCMVAIAAGNYVENLVLDRGHDGVHLAGRCRELVTVDGSEGAEEDSPAIFVWGGLYDTMEVSGLTAAEGGGGVVVRASEVRLDRVVLRDNAILGLFVASAARVTATELYIHGTSPSRYEDFGYGVSVEGTAWLTLESSVIEHNHNSGVLAVGHGADVVLRDTAVRGTLPLPDDTFGRGVSVQEGANLLAESCAIEGNVEVGLLASGEETVVTLRNTAVRDTAPLPDGTLGRGVWVHGGAQLTAESCAIEGNHDIGLSGGGGAEIEATSCDIAGNMTGGVAADDERTSVTLRGSTVRDSRANADLLGGAGIQAAAGASLVVESCVVEGNQGVGVIVGDPETSVVMLDTTVRDTATRHDGALGRGVQVTGGAQLVAESCTVERNLDEGVRARGEWTVVTLVDTAIRDTAKSTEAISGGFGISAMDGAELTAESCLVEGSSAGGVTATSADTEVTLRDTVVRGGRSPANTWIGFGIQLDAGANLMAESCVIDGTRYFGVAAFDQGTTVTLLDTIIRNTTPLSDGSLGRGIAVQHGAELTAESCAIDGNAEVGVSAGGEGASVTLRDVVVRDTRRGTATSAAVAVGCQQHARVTATGLDVRGTEGPGLRAATGCELSCDGCLIEDNTFAGALVDLAGRLDLSQTAIAFNHPDDQEGGGLGVWVIGNSNLSGGYGPSTLLLSGTTITDHSIAAVWLDGPGSYQLLDSTLQGGPGVTNESSPGNVRFHGDAVFAMGGVTPWDSEEGLLLEGTTFHDGVTGVFLHAASATLGEDNAFTGNQVDLWQQGSWEYDEPIDGDLSGLEAVIDPVYDRVVFDDLSFDLYLQEIEHPE